MKAVEKYLLPIPENLKERAEGVNKLISVMDVICAYSPDHDKGGIYQSVSPEIADYFGVSVNLGRYLDAHFFDELYVENSDLKDKINGYLSGSNHLTLLIGRVGVGKTVFLLSLKKEIEKASPVVFLYINLRKDISQGKKRYDDYIKSINQLIYTEIHDRILNKDLITSYRNHLILFDDFYTNFKFSVEISLGLKLATEDDVDLVMSDTNVQERLLEYPQQPDLNSLLSFLVKKEIKIILCFDNVDQRSYKEQSQLLYHCYQISETYGVPTILAIRETNLNQVMKEAREKQQDKAPDSSYIFLENLNNATPERRPNFLQVLERKPNVIKNMIERRFRILQNIELLPAIAEYRRTIIEEYGYSEETFNQKFWHVFESITSEFVEEGIYKFSNFNLRYMFVRYVGFTTALMLNPEEEYRYDKLMEPGRADKTKLRTFLIKWLISGKNLIPDTENGILNIFRFPLNELSMLELKVLLYINNFEKRNKDKKLLFQTIKNDFEWLKISHITLELIINHLSNLNGPKERGLIWVDDQSEDAISDHSIIETNPAAIYFLESLSVTREYAFWEGITSDLPEDIVERKFNLSDTYDDKFKLEVVANLITKVLLPAYENDIKMVCDLPRHDHWQGTTFDYFKEKFLRDGRCYVDHLCTSVRATIDYSSFSNESDRRILQNQYDDLKKRIHLLKNRYG